MKSSVTTLEDNKVKLSVEVDESELDIHIGEAFKKIAKEIRLPGFRPGKAPRKVLEARIGKEYARGEALQTALPEYYRQAIIEHDVDVIAPPDLDVTSGEEDGPVEFEAVVEVRPQITVAGYNGLRIEMPAPGATDEEVDAQIASLRSQFAERVEVDRPAVEGDYVTMDISGSMDGEPVDGLTAEDYTYEVGAGFVVDSLDEHLVGAAVGDDIEFEDEHPDPDVEGMLVFNVSVNKIEEKQLPELTDEFAAEASEFETVEALLADTRKRIETGKRSQAEMLIAQKTGDALAELVDVDVPESLVQDQVQRQLQDMAMRMAQQGMQLEQFLQATGQSITDLTDTMKEPAEQAAKVDLALRSVILAEGMELTDDELQAELDQSAGAIGQTGAELRAAFEENGQLSSLKIDILKERAMDQLIASVEIVDEDGHAIDRADLLPVTEQDAEVGDTDQDASADASEPADQDQPQNDDADSVDAPADAEGDDT